MVGGVLGHVGVEGFLADREDEDEVCDPAAEDWAAFVPVWAEAFGEKQMPTRELLDLAVRNGAFQFDPGAAPDSRAKASFGKALTKQRGCRYGLWRITVSRDRNKKVNLYGLEP